MTSWLVRSTILFFSFEYAVAKECFTLDKFVAEGQTLVSSVYDSGESSSTTMAPSAGTSM